MTENTDDLELEPDERVIDVEIEGRKPGLLMNSARSMLLPASPKKGTCPHGKLYEEKCDECIEVCAYRTEDGDLYIPSEVIYASMVNAAGGYKIGNKSARQFMAGCVRICPDEVLLGATEYDVDVRPVNIRGSGRVIRMRPWMKQWKVAFKIVYDATFVSANKIEPWLKDAGRRIGIMDFRPQHKGRFGTFNITKWEEQ